MFLFLKKACSCPHLYTFLTLTNFLVPLECLCNWAITQNVLSEYNFMHNNESMSQCFCCTYNSFTRGRGGHWAAVLPRAANALATRRYNNGSRYYYSDNKRYESSSSKWYLEARAHSWRYWIALLLELTFFGSYFNTEIHWWTIAGLFNFIDSGWIHYH